MKRLIKRITSASLTAVLSIVTIASPLKVSAAEAVPKQASSPIVLAKDNMVGSDVDGTFELTGITGIDTAGNYQINVPEGSTKLLIKAEFFRTADGADIVLGQNVEMEKPSEGGVISGIDFANNNKIVGSLPFSNTFKGFTKLTKVNNLGLAINALSGSSSNSLDSTFEGCTALESISIDLVSSAGKVSFLNTFKGCTQLNSVSIKNANIDSLSFLFGTDKASVPTGEVSLVINNSKLNDESLVKNIASYFNGSINIKNSSDLRGEGLDIGNLVSYNDDSNKGRISFDFTGSKINSIKGLVRGTWNSFTANNIFSTETKTISAILDNTTKLSKAPTITGTKPTALDVIEYPFKGLDLTNDVDEIAAVTSFLKGLDLTKCSRYSALFETSAARASDSGYNFTDLSELELNSSSDSVYENFSGGTHSQDYFITAKSFGGSYILPFEAWKYSDDENASQGTKIEPDETGVSMVASEGVTGFKYNHGKLEASTKYEPAKAIIKIIDVATSKTSIGRYENENPVESTEQYKGDVEYFEDELLQRPYKATGKKLVAGEVLTLYYTSDPNFKPTVDNNQKDVTLNVVWEDTDASARPNTINVEWKAETETGESTTGSNSISSNKLVSTQTETIKVPTNIEGKAIVKYTFTADLTGTGYGYETIVEDTPDTIKLVIKKSTSGPSDNESSTTKPGNENLIDDIPADVTINYGKDTKKITATLEDGTTKPLVSDATKTTTIVKRSDQTVYQKPAGLNSDKFVFYDISITIEDSGKVHNVKSVDSPIGIAIEIPADCDISKPIKVYHYLNGIMVEPEEIRNASITGTHVVIPTTSYSFYGIAYSTLNTEKRTITIDWDDVGYETDRPTSVVADWTATYANDTTLKGTVVFNRDTKVKTQTQTFDVAKKNGNSALVSVVSNVRAVTGYTIQPKAGDALGWTIKWNGLTAKVITHTFKFDFSDAPADKRPTEYKFKVVGNYSDGYKENKEFTVPIGADGTGSQKVTFDLERAGAPGSNHEFTTWDYPEIDGFSLSSSGLIAIFKYNGGAGTNANQTVYPITITFAGDNGNTDKRPTQVEITWTSVTKKTLTTTTGNAIVPLANGVNSVTHNVTIPNNTTEERTVTVTGPVINGYTMSINGHTINYNYAQAANPAQTTANFTIAFEDNNNKAGRRPSEIKITLADTAEAGNTVTTTVKIPDNVTTTTSTYTGSVQIPAGKTYAITKVENLPTGYSSTTQGLKATLKYTPETIEKTFKVVWEGDVEEIRPSSIQMPVKVGEETLQTLVLSKDTNWAVTAKLPKYIRGVEVSYQLTPPTITNYAATVNGDTVTMKYTGTLTEKQKEAIANNAEKDAEAEKEKEAIYDYEAFDWIDYANRYPDLKKAFGYNKEALYAHYIKYGISEGRVATWTSKYANVNNDILAAYFPDDYKFKVKNPDALGEMVDQMNKDTTTETVTKEEVKGTVTVDENGNTIITKDNQDGTVTETIIDKDGNVVQTKTYATGDNRLMVASWVYIAIIITALGLVAVYYSEFRKCSKAKKVINDFIES